MKRKVRHYKAVGAGNNTYSGFVGRYIPEMCVCCKETLHSLSKMDCDKIDVFSLDRDLFVKELRIPKIGRLCESCQKVFDAQEFYHERLNFFNTDMYLDKEMQIPYPEGLTIHKSHGSVIDTIKYKINKHIKRED